MPNMTLCQDEDFEEAKTVLLHELTIALEEAPTHLYDESEILRKTIKDIIEGTDDGIQRVEEQMLLIQIERRQEARRIAHREASRWNWAIWGNLFLDIWSAPFLGAMYQVLR